jgi:hypothetical protein
VRTKASRAARRASITCVSNLPQFTTVNESLRSKILPQSLVYDSKSLLSTFLPYEMELLTAALWLKRRLPGRASRPAAAAGASACRWDYIRLSLSKHSD